MDGNFAIFGDILKRKIEIVERIRLLDRLEKVGNLMTELRMEKRRICSFY